MDHNTRAEKSPIKVSRKANIISMRLDAAFFFERGVRFLERNDLKKALKAFEKTVEYEPNNPVNHCNLAGVLSEIGDFESSNKILLHVLKDLDPSMVECHFYLANNYANMGEYETAEEYVLGYLDADPDGEYVEDAEEMLDILLDEFGGGKAYAKWEDQRKQNERAQAKRDGRHLLEEGKFEAAVEWLESIVDREPENTAAYNNLSLAYYYTGQYDFAVDTAHRVLAWQPNNIHALCNMAVFAAHLGTREQLQIYTTKLRKIFPVHYDHAMKVATTLGLIGDHEAALNVFQSLARISESPEPVLMHSLAASAANIGRFSLARKWWRALSQVEEMSEIALYYLETLERAVRNGNSRLRVSYQYDLPLQVQLTEMKKRLQHGSLTSWRQDPLLRASLYWGLRHGTTDIQKAVIRTLALIADEDAEKALRAFLKRSDLSASLQSSALYALSRMGARGRLEYWQEGVLTSRRMSAIPKTIILSIDPNWQEIMHSVEAWLRKEHKTRYINEAKQTWIGFLKHAFGRGEVGIGKRDVWVAGLIYAVMKRHNEVVRQKDIAEKFGVSVSSVSKTAGRLSKFFVKMP
jgi:tetratricopeptide (TPR) repeat protein